MKNLIKGSVTAVVCSVAAGVGASAGTWIRTAENPVSTSHVTKSGYFDVTKANEISYQEETNGNMWVIAQDKTTVSKWTLQLNGKDTEISSTSVTTASQVDRDHLTLLPSNGSGIILATQDSTNDTFYSIVKKSNGTFAAVKIKEIAIASLTSANQSLDAWTFWGVGANGYLAYFTGASGSNATFTMETYTIPTTGEETVTTTAVQPGDGVTAPTGANIHNGFLGSNTDRGFVFAIEKTSTTYSFVEIKIGADSKYTCTETTTWMQLSNIQSDGNGGYFFLAKKDSSADNSGTIITVSSEGTLTEGITLDPAKITEVNTLGYYMMDKEHEVYFPIAGEGSVKKLLEIKSSAGKTFDSKYDVTSGMPEGPTVIDSMMYVGDHFDTTITDANNIKDIYSVSTSDQTASSNTALIVLGAVFGSLAVVGIAGGLGYYFYSKKNTKGGNKKPSMPAGDKPATPASKPESK